MESKEFSLGQILSITDGRLLTRNHMEGIYEILNFMTGESLSIVALPRARRECMPYLMEEFSSWIELAHADIAEFFATQKTSNEIWDWMSDIEQKYGNQHTVYPIHPEDHEVLDPSEDVLRINPSAQIITMDFQDDEEISPYGDINWKLEDD